MRINGSIIGTAITSSASNARGIWDLRNLEIARRLGLWPNVDSIVTSGLRLNLDAGNTTSYPGSGTTWYDISGNSNNATLVNGPTFDSNNGGSIVFDGTNDYVSNTISNPGSMPITFEFWIYSNSSSPVGIFDTAPNTGDVLRNYSAGNVEWHIASPSIALGLSANTWTNITLQFYFSTNRTIEYYKNGSLITTGTGSTSSTYAWNSLTFGNINGGSAGSYSGKMSVIRIYNRTLSSAEVLQNYNAIKNRFGL
jgi:hypothetical protein